MISKRKNKNMKKLILMFLVTVVIVIIFKLWPETKAQETSTIKVTYKPGDGIGTEITVDQPIINKGTQGDIDYTNNKIVLYGNKETIADGRTINFECAPIEYNEKTYERILTGWKLTSVTKNGTKLTTFVEPENENYANPDDAQKDIDTVYAQNGWYVVPNSVTEIEVTAVYGRAIYVRSPYDKMHYDEYHIFYYGENNDGTTTKDGGTAVAKSSDDNYGTSQEDAVATLKRAYELMNSDENLTVYDTVFSLCGDLYEVSYRSTGKIYVTGRDGTYQNYRSDYLGYNFDINKPVTISSVSNKKYNLYACASSYDICLKSALRIDNLNIASLTKSLLEDIHNTDVSIDTYPRFRMFKMQENQAIEVTETVTSAEVNNMWYQKAKYVKLNGGYWNLYWYSAPSTNTAPDGQYLRVGGTSRIDLIGLFQASTSKENGHIITNPAKIIVTGGKIGEIYGTSSYLGGHVKGDVYIHVSDGSILSIYGAGNSSVYSNESEKGNVNINIYGGAIGNIYGAGRIYASSISGDVNLNIKNATITGNVYGGGKGGSVKGSVNFNISNSNISGNVFGGGEGLTDNFTYDKVSNNGFFEAGWNSVVSNFNKNTKRSCNWEEPPTGFPVYDNQENQIITRVYHVLSYEVNYRYCLYERRGNSALTLSKISGDVNLVVEDSTINKNIYGGGSIALVEGNISVKVLNSTVYGNIFGGGDGLTKPEGITLYQPIKKENYVVLTPDGIKKDNNNKIGIFLWSDDKDILNYFNGIYDGKNDIIYEANGTTKSFDSLGEQAKKVIEKYGDSQLVYSEDAQKLGMVNGNIELELTNVKISEKSEIYGGGNAGKVEGSTKVTINSGEYKNVYGGGSVGDIAQNTEVIFNSGTANEVYGGGYSGNVGQNTTVKINKGNFTNIFGGGNLGVVASSNTKGNTIVNIGNENDEGIIITGLVYGGGRGKIPEGENDARNFTTVYGDSTVIIEGINTKLENYGSVKLGKVEGDINVTFKNYWTGNATIPYKRMNGIDKATNVNFDKSYVLLENNELGIEAIENLNIPEGSGLKISANGKITGNFNGGGELYLDSEVCLEVEGEITGTTKIVLNPLLNMIQGGSENPYMKVATSLQETSGKKDEASVALKSGDNRYTILYDNITEEITKYYIKESITIDNIISDKIKISKGRIYKKV